MNHRILDPIPEKSGVRGDTGCHKEGGGEPLSVFGMPEISKIPLVITTYLEQKRPMLLICPNDYMAQRLYAAMSPVLPGETYFLPARAFSFTRAVDSREQRALRIQALTALAGGEPCLVLAGVDGARACLSPRSVFCKSQITVHKGTPLHGRPHPPVGSGRLPPGGGGFRPGGILPTGRYSGCVHAHGRLPIGLFWGRGGFHQDHGILCLSGALRHRMG